MSRTDGGLGKYDVEVQIPGVDGELVWLRVGSCVYVADAKQGAAALAANGWRFDRGVATLRPVTAARAIVRATGEHKTTSWATGEQLRAALRFNAALLA